MSDPAARRALLAALGDRRRNLAALLLVCVALAVAVSVESPLVRYGAALVVFTVWMGWFVLAAIDWLRHADF